MFWYSVTMKENSPSKLPSPAVLRQRRRAAAGFGVALAFLGINEAKPIGNAGKKVVNHISRRATSAVDTLGDKTIHILKSRSPEAQVPPFTDPDQQEKIEQGLKDGKLTIVKTDEEHPLVWDVAREINPNANVGDTSDMIVGSLQDADVPVGTELVVPATKAALELHEQQFLQSQSQNS